MVDTTTRRSPLAGQAPALAGLPISARELPFLTQLNLRTDPDGPAAASIGRALGGTLPVVPSTASRFGEVDVLWLGPDEWLLLAPSGQEEALAATVRRAIGEADGAVTDVSAQRTAVALTGPRVREVLARGCSIDLHPKAAPAGSCVQTLLAQTGVTILVRDETSSDFLLLVRSSFAEYFAAWLIDACTELGE
jgi:sarcosine oxidase, subunit gamma